MTNKWLDDFAYRIHPSIWIFAGSLAAILLVTLITVSFQAIKAAMANPTESLRSQ